MNIFHRFDGRNESYQYSVFHRLIVMESNELKFIVCNRNIRLKFPLSSDNDTIWLDWIIKRICHLLLIVVDFSMNSQIGLFLSIEIKTIFKIVWLRMKFNYKICILFSLSLSLSLDSAQLIIIFDYRGKILR